MRSPLLWHYLLHDLHHQVMLHANTFFLQTFSRRHVRYCVTMRRQLVCHCHVKERHITMHGHGQLFLCPDCITCGMISCMIHEIMLDASGTMQHTSLMCYPCARMRKLWPKVRQQQPQCAYFTPLKKHL